MTTVDAPIRVTHARVPLLISVFDGDYETIKTENHYRIDGEVNYSLGQVK